jgi:nicotinate dehydrogenase subunit A
MSDSPAASTSQPRTVRLFVNGQTHEVRVDPTTPLIYVLRNDLGLKAAKLGCGLEQCGACKVLVDGEALPSCRVPVSVVEGCDIVTLEGIGAAGRLHPVQQAFIDEQAVQCGYCTPGMVLAAVALLERNAQPSDDEIRTALERHLCRCGAYNRIVRAVRRAAGEIVS